MLKLKRSVRYPGAGSHGVRQAIVTNRNKKMKVTLAKGVHLMLDGEDTGVVYKTPRKRKHKK